MIAISSQSAFESNGNGWPSEQNHIYRGGETPAALTILDLPAQPSPWTVSDFDLVMAKKFNHNASERDRRKKINFLFSSLRSLLPHADQRKRQSNPAMVSEVLKYIPYLQKQVEELTHKKKQLMTMIIPQPHQQNKRENGSSAAAVSATRLNDKEIVVHISTQIHTIIPFSQILLTLEEDGLHSLNVSSAHSHGGRLFYTLHLQVEKDDVLLPCLNEKVMQLFENINNVIYKQSLNNF